MDWFEKLTGFREAPYEETQRLLEVGGSQLTSLVNGRSYGIGELELVSLGELRRRAADAVPGSGRLSVKLVTGDVGMLHRQPELAGALFQVASQFNLLEMVGPEVTPEHGVTRYQHDATQGPACAIAAGAGTIYRNYFVPIGDARGQRAHRQLDGLADLGIAFAGALGCPVQDLWMMKNGYALCTRDGLTAIGQYLQSLDEAARADLRDRLRIGVHWDVEVTAALDEPRPRVSHAYCSALPVAYTSIPQRAWRPFSELVLEAAYEATLLAAVLNRSRSGSRIVLLTRLGGGAFGNDEHWIESAMRRALHAMAAHDLDVRLVSYGAPTSGMTALANEFGAGGRAPASPSAGSRRRHVPEAEDGAGTGTGATKAVARPGLRSGGTVDAEIPLTRAAASLQVRQLSARQQQLDRAALPWRPLYETQLLQRHQHLMDRGRRNLEIGPKVRFGGRTPVDLRVVVDKGKVLPLLGGVSASRAALCRR